MLGYKRRFCGVFSEPFLESLPQLLIMFVFIIADANERKSIFEAEYLLMLH